MLQLWRQDSRDLEHYLCKKSKRRESQLQFLASQVATASALRCCMALTTSLMRDTSAVQRLALHAADTALPVNACLQR